MIIGYKAPLTESYSEALSAWRADENKSSNYEETQMIYPVASHSGATALTRWMNAWLIMLSM